VDSLRDKRNELEKQIVEIAFNEIDKKALTVDQAREIMIFWLSKTKTATNEEELLNFVTEFVSKWPIFSPVAIIEQGKIRREYEGKVTDDVMSLVNSGKIEEALALAKSANN
jgi:hypothetical protein